MQFYRFGSGGLPTTTRDTRVLGNVPGKEHDLAYVIAYIHAFIPDEDRHLGAGGLALVS